MLGHLVLCGDFKIQKGIGISHHFTQVEGSSERVPLHKKHEVIQTTLLDALTG